MSVLRCTPNHTDYCRVGIRHTHHLGYGSWSTRSCGRMNPLVTFICHVQDSESSLWREREWRRIIALATIDPSYSALWCEGIILIVQRFPAFFCSLEEVLVLMVYWLLPCREFRGQRQIAQGGRGGWRRSWRKRPLSSRMPRVWWRLPELGYRLNLVCKLLLLNLSMAERHLRIAQILLRCVALSIDVMWCDVMCQSMYCDLMCPLDTRLRTV